MRPEKERWTIRDVQVVTVWFIENSTAGPHYTCSHLAAIGGLFTWMLVNDVYNVEYTQLSEQEKAALAHFDSSIHVNREIVPSELTAR